MSATGACDGRHDKSELGIFVVEDDEAVLRALTRGLVRHGYRVVSAGCAADARRQTERFVVGLFDIDLPDGDGVALARELLASGCVARAIFYSGSENRATVAHARQLGAVVSKRDGLAAVLAAL